MLFDRIEFWYTDSAQEGHFRDRKGLPCFAQDFYGMTKDNRLEEIAQNRRD